jgi:DNA polymerase-3 subunit beta
MKFTCRQENLEKGLNQVYRAVPNKANLPILSNVHLLAESGRLRISATNLDTSIITYVGASIEEEGAITVPAKLFRDFVSNLPEGVITVTLDKNILKVEMDHNSARLNTVSADEYPEVPTMHADMDALVMDSAEFVDAVKSVVFAAASDDTRPVFSGVFLSFVDGIFNIVASDGFRLSEKTIKMDTLFNSSFSAIIPAKTLLEVSRLISQEEPTSICLDSKSNLVMFKNQDIIVGTRIVEGQFPDYKRIIPAEHSLEVEMASSDLLSAVRLADVFAQQVDSSMKIRFDPEGSVHISASSPESGEHTSSFEATIEGDAVEIVLNSKYLLDFLNNVSSEKICLHTQSSLSPCVLHPLEKENFLHLIMPRQNRD